ncbi:hypothetical protein [Pseudoalteromonas denitrificans]|uniref:Uncharacterized protein n=1 Tax=Pseudoalteromonas denitrificans DSM 6059 TaxID=1123010 RepID=A0A1I1RA07_9GAMM|nr:hypothetical protein [Pseudoalteromonas denitrificans]SFD27220.1 hypothetical protein SAMN02745724_04054 [Pseudoalteromonas denitrificans DSM 6059]
MKLHFKAPFIFVSIILFITSIQSYAHALKETTARVILRDGQIEIHLQADIQQWQKRLQDHQAWLMGDIKTVMPANLNRKQTTHYFIQQLIEKTKLKVNNQDISVKVTAFEQKNSSGHHFSNIVLMAKHTQSSVEQLSIGFPKTLGDIHANFVQPKYRVIKSGKIRTLAFKHAHKSEINIKKLNSHHNNTPTNTLSHHISAHTPDQIHTH